MSSKNNSCKYFKGAILCIFNYIYKLNIKFFLISILIIIIYIFLFCNIINLNSSNHINIGYYCRCIKYGGIERVMAQLINYLSNENKFINYLLTIQGILTDEYSIPNKTIRISLQNQNISIFEAIEKYHIDILIYNFYVKKDIEKLNKLNNTKVIFYDHSSYFCWLYLNVHNITNSFYNLYKESKYVISLIPVENNYLFKKWGINSILMDNPTTFEYNYVTPSELKEKNIIMVGRSNDKIKRFDLGIKAMKVILKDIPNCEMNIVSTHNKHYQRLIEKLNLSEHVRFVGFKKQVETYFKNSSLHIMPSLAEAYPMVLGEAKIFGVPTILCGLDYISLAKGGNIIIYDDNPIIIAKEAIKILKDDKYRMLLGKEARESMKNHTNKIIANKWFNIIKSVYKGDNKSYHKVSENDNKLSDEERDIILNNQYKLFIKRNPKFRNLTFQNFIDFNF